MIDDYLLEEEKKQEEAASKREKKVCGLQIINSLSLNFMGYGYYLKPIDWSYITCMGVLIHYEL